jgi:ATP-dependent Clp protease ATP-binding subunit ClpA
MLRGPNWKDLATIRVKLKIQLPAMTMMLMMIRLLEAVQEAGSQKKQGESKSKTPVLDNFGRDLPKWPEEGKLDPVVGREKEIERVSQILITPQKKQSYLIGEPGVGKSSYC